MCPASFQLVALAVPLVLAAGCTQDMADQPRYEPLEASGFFANGMASRPLVEGTVARGHLRTDADFYEGRQGAQLTSAVPVPAVAASLGLTGDEAQLRRAILLLGQQRFDIYCAPCHDRAATGQGMVVLRGFPAPPSLHSERLRQAPDGHLFDVASRGFGRMPSYADQVSTADRWAIVAYVRALQLSQHAPAADLSADDLDLLQRSGGNP